MERVGVRRFEKQVWPHISLSYFIYLQESLYKVLSGRFGDKSGHHVYIFTWGKAVLDYVFVPHDALEKLFRFQDSAL